MSQVTLTWTASTSTVDGYNVYRGAAAGQETTKLNTALVTGTSFVDTAPVVGQDFYVVKSSAAGVESIASNEVSVVILPQPPTNLVAKVG
jgi:fibronectin type 3 domain-containing protein